MWFLVKHGKDYDIFIMERLDKGIEYLEKVNIMVLLL